MVEWWESLNLIQQVFAVTGIAATILLVIQVILMMFGLGDGASGDAGSPNSTFTSDVHLPGSDGSQISADLTPPEINIGEIQIDVPDGNANIDLGLGDYYTNGDTGQPAPHAASGVHLFTLQGFIAFFAVFGWTGLAVLKAGVPSAAAVAVAVGLGLVAMYALALVYKLMLRLQQDGTGDIRYAVGKTASVYIPIPPKRERPGKVTVMVGNTLMELDAVTDDLKPIPTGREVVVIGVSNNTTLLVSPK